MRPLPQDLSNPARARILECVTSVPGIHLRSVERETQLPLGQVLYHLDRLERMDLIVSSRDAGFRRYYLTRAIARDEKRFLAALRHQVPRRILLALLRTPRTNHKELQRILGVAGSTLSFHLHRLLDSHVLIREREGAANLYSISEPEIVTRELVDYGESFHDDEVDRYVESLRDS